VFTWEILVPAQRYVFSVGAEGLVEHNRTGDSSADRFKRYQSLKSEHPVHGMIAWPNTILLRGPCTAVVDPGILVQGPPVLLALAERGLRASDVELVINTHMHPDHSQANLLFPGATLVVHQEEWQSYPESSAGGSPLADVRLLEGDSGEICPGLEFVHTPGHSEGSICILAQVSSDSVILAGDTVGPLPEHFEQMDLPLGFPERERLLVAWRRLRGLGADVLVPGHNPPVRLS
jgi:glyoxylase-like metal-dependent hydrolase (beta-lactamase superfamily II)